MSNQGKTPEQIEDSTTIMMMCVFCIIWLIAVYVMIHHHA